jgi:hypothetical protein
MPNALNIKKERKKKKGQTKFPLISTSLSDLG